MAFRTGLPELAANAAPWWEGPNLETLTSAVGAEMDAQAALVLDARLQAIPWGGSAKLADGRPIQCEPYVLPIHAAQRGIRLYETEPLQSQRVRLARWRQLHRRRGTPRGILEHVQPYFLGTDGSWPVPVMSIVSQDGDGVAVWRVLDPVSGYSVTKCSGGGAGAWNWDGVSSKWSRWWLIIRDMVDGVQVPALTPSPTHDGGGAYDGSAPWLDGLLTAVALDDVAMSVDWKGGHSRCAGIVIDRISAGSPGLGPTTTLTSDPTGWTSLPNGAWSLLVYGGVNVRPPYLDFIYEDPT